MIEALLHASSPHSAGHQSVSNLVFHFHYFSLFLPHSLCFSCIYVCMSTLDGMSTAVSGFGGNGYGDLDRCDLFDDIQREVFRLMETNLWTSFKQSYR